MFLECLYSRENKGDVLTNSSVKFQGTTSMLGLQQHSTSLLSWPTLTLHKTIRPRSDMPTTVSKKDFHCLKINSIKLKFLRQSFKRQFPLLLRRAHWYNVMCLDDTPIVMNLQKQLSTTYAQRFYSSVLNWSYVAIIWNPTFIWIMSFSQIWAMFTIWINSFS